MAKILVLEIVEISFSVAAVQSVFLTVSMIPGPVALTWLYL